MKRCAGFLVCLQVFLTLYTIPLYAMPNGAYVYPLVGTRISSDFGNRVHPILRAVKHHSGIDLAAPFGSQVRAVKDGVVIYSDPYGGYGNLIVIQHENGMTTHYGHCRTLIAKPGQKIRAGQIIATVGSTGISTGPHLHFEIRMNGVAKDPQTYIPGLADDAVG
jgi:murein DD-endopeptidase MepM/ murein hydrolase activator NlpD